MSNIPQIIIPCPVCKIPVAPKSSAELTEWFPRHVVASPQCASGDVRDMVQEFETIIKKMREVAMKKYLGENK